MTPQRFAVVVVLPVLLVALLTAFFRLVRGPSLPDRVVAFDLLATVGIGILTVHAIETSQPVYVDDTIVLALVSFLGTIGFANFLRRMGS